MKPAQQRHPLVAPDPGCQAGPTRPRVPQSLASANAANRVMPPTLQAVATASLLALIGIVTVSRDNGGLALSQRRERATAEGKILIWRQKCEYKGTQKNTWSCKSTGSGLIKGSILMTNFNATLPDDPRTLHFKWK
jgi:hypothetical protein